MKKDVYFSKHENDDFDEYEDISSGRRDEIIKKEHKKKHRARRTIIFLLPQARCVATIPAISTS